MAREPTLGGLALENRVIFLGSKINRRHRYFTSQLKKRVDHYSNEDGEM